MAREARVVDLIVSWPHTIASSLHRDEAFQRLSVVEPFWIYTQSADVVLWSMLAVLLVGDGLCPQRVLPVFCPVGATLGVLSALTVFGIRRWSECKTCTNLREDVRVGRNGRTEIGTETKQF